MTQKTYAEKVAETVIEKLKNGTAPWIKPWQPGEQPEPPKNALTGNEYRGINNVLLSVMQPDLDPRYCTYKQAESLGGTVQKGATGLAVQFWKFDQKALVRDENKKPVLDAKGDKQYKKLPPKPFYATVFHASQIDGLQKYIAPEVPALNDIQRHARAETLLDASKATILNDQADRAFYNARSDEIHLPEMGQFHSQDAYYATAFHELGHWTGHESRLDRPFAALDFDKEGYAKEELRAELASYMLGEKLGIGHDPDQHTAYIGSWIKALEEDPNEIIHAARDAQKACDYVLNIERELVKETDLTLTQEEQESIIKEVKTKPGAQRSEAELER